MDFSSSQSSGNKTQGRREEMRRDPFQLQNPAQRAKLWHKKMKSLLTNKWVQAHIDGLADYLLTVSDYYGSTSSPYWYKQMSSLILGRQLKEPRRKRKHRQWGRTIHKNVTHLLVSVWPQKNVANKICTSMWG